jgi:hypothetical protein
VTKPELQAEQVAVQMAVGIAELRPGPTLVRVVTAEAFAEVEEEGGAALLGTPDSAVVCEGSDVMIYGDGGAGKTTLALDLGCHLVAGDDWIEIQIPEPLHVLLIENEGPRPQFRRKVRRKIECWTGSPLGGRLRVLEDPWGGFTFADPAWRQTLAEVVRADRIDLVIVGPLTASGMVAAGTLQETRQFIALVDDARERAGRRFANLLIHHENRGGKVSGAWEGTGDTLLHLSQQAHGRVRLEFQKTRWSSDRHGTSLQLAWVIPGERFQLIDDGPPRPERVWEDIADYVLTHGGCGWVKIEREVSGQGDYLRRRRDSMLDEGVLINTGTGQKFQLWHRDDPDRPTLKRATVSEEGHGLDTTVSATEDGAETGTVSPCPVLSRDTGRDTVGSTSPGDLEPDAEGGPPRP